MVRGCAGTAERTSRGAVTATGEGLRYKDVLPEDALCGMREGAGVRFCGNAPRRSSCRPEGVGLLVTGCPTTGEGSLELMPLPHTELAKGAGVEKAGADCVAKVVLTPEVAGAGFAAGGLFAAGGGGVPFTLAPENKAGWTICGSALRRVPAILPITLGSRLTGSPTRGEGNGLLLPTVIELASGAGRLIMGELTAGV